MENVRGLSGQVEVRANLVYDKESFENALLISWQLVYTCYDERE